MSWYRLTVFSHVLGAVLAVGPTFTYGAWLALGRRAGEREQVFAFRGVMWVDSHIATPAFLWQLVSGILLVSVFDVAKPGQLWLDISMGLYMVIAIVALAVVGPRARRALKAAESEGPQAPAYVSYRALMAKLGPPIAIGTLAILFLMVTKPG